MWPLKITRDVTVTYAGYHGIGSGYGLGACVFRQAQGQFDARNLLPRIFLLRTLSYRRSSPLHTPDSESFSPYYVPRCRPLLGGNTRTRPVENYTRFEAPDCGTSHRKELALTSPDSSNSSCTKSPIATVIEPVEHAIGCDERSYTQVVQGGETLPICSTQIYHLRMRAACPHTVSAVRITKKIFRHCRWCQLLHCCFSVTNVTTISAFDRSICKPQTRPSQIVVVDGQKNDRLFCEVALLSV